MAKRTAALAAAATAVVIAGWLGVAVADNTTTTTPPANGTATQPAQGMPGPGGPGGFGKMGHRGPGGPERMGGMKGAIHGQFTVPNGSGYRTVASQRGTVTAVSQSSITVKSADGFEKKYSVTPNTLVNAGRDGIGSVKNGDTVNVEAVEGSGDPEAMNIMDQTTTKAIHDHWAPAPAPTTTTTTG
jgi:hypothetical protein